ncbi:SpoIIE family protein phosphatase [Saccharothrix violaceirubra]|uniref:PAS domain S-box-containing protein n=1 Tax=Saccharothrix violaceirubra TaxID=413306 RepID=A0A7W7T3Z9_9PSEU|nr:SpoIIE family protein phosphatase [Saccharothrix violaceirubra]MBB4966128.1 PAS domain S-box-containing protein [Saccharothrix violaceirubra]
MDDSAEGGGRHLDRRLPERGLPGHRESACRELVDGVPVVVWEAEARTGELRYVSAAARRRFGQVVTRWRDFVHPDDLDEVTRTRRARIEDSTEYELTYRAVTASGDVVWLHERAAVTGSRLRGVLVDTTGQRVVEERERFLASLDRALQRLDDAEDVLATATRMLAEHLGVDRCVYARADEDDDLPAVDGFVLADFGAGAVKAMRAGRPWVVEDSESDPGLTRTDLVAYRRTGIRAVICLPLSRAGRFVGAMAASQATGRRWTDAEVALVSLVVNRCWESAQRADADRASREGERRLRLLVERATDVIWVLDRELRLVEVNPAACALLGYGRTELLDRHVGELVVSGPHADLRQRDTTEVWELRRADGGVVAVEMSVQDTPTGYQAIGRDVTERRRADAERDRRLHREHEIAETLQRSLLPHEPPALERLASAARYLPASSHSRIGGDWYDVLPVGATAVAMSVGDVVGKGPAAAAVMGQLRSALSGYLLDGHSPAAALERLDTFAARIDGAAGSTCACLVFDWDTGELRLAIAGHPAPLVVDAHGGRFRGTPAGPVLGSRGRAPYRDDVTTLPPGATVVLYTDGLVERRGEPIDFGLDRLLRVAAAGHARPPGELADAITDDLLAGGREDDVALVVARHLPEPLRRRVPAVPGELALMRRRVGRWAAQAGLAEDLAYDLQLALGEAAANAVDHAYPDGPGDFDYSVSVTTSGVRVRVSDQGRWRPSPVDPGHRGRGLGMIRMLSDEVLLDHDEHGTTVVFHLPTVSAAPRPVAHTGPFERVDVVVRLTGALDRTTIERTRADLLGRVAAGGVEIDLTAVEHLSSSGVALLLEAASAAGRRPVVTVRAGSAPARVLTLSGLTGPGGPLDVRLRP